MCERRREKKKREGEGGTRTCLPSSKKEEVASVEGTRHSGSGGLSLSSLPPYILTISALHGNSARSRSPVRIFFCTSLCLSAYNLCPVFFFGINLT